MDLKCREKIYTVLVYEKYLRMMIECGDRKNNESSRQHPSTVYMHMKVYCVSVYQLKKKIKKILHINTYTLCVFVIPAGDYCGICARKHFEWVYIEK